MIYPTFNKLLEKMIAEEKAIGESKVYLTGGVGGG